MNKKIRNEIISLSKYADDPHIGCYRGSVVSQDRMILLLMFLGSAGLFIFYVWAVIL